MQADIELLIFPYDAARGRTLLRLLIDELGTNDWTHFQAAVAFAKISGNFPALLAAMQAFASRGNRVDITFGADRFSAETKGSDYEAVEGVLSALNGEPTASVFLHRDKDRTFHPKVYLFSNLATERAMVVIGSSNWSEGGFGANVEANVLLRLDLKNESHKKCLADLRRCFEENWNAAQ